MESRRQRVNGRLDNPKKPPADGRWPVCSKWRLARLPGARIVVAARVVVGVAAIAAVATVIRATTVIDGSAAIVSRRGVVVAIAVVIIVVAPALRGRNREPCADDAGEGRCCRCTTATAIIPAARTEIGRAAGAGRDALA